MEGTSRHRPDGCREMLRLAPGIRTRSVIQVLCAARQSAQIKLIATSLVDPKLTTDECRVGDGRGFVLLRGRSRWNASGGWGPECLNGFVQRSEQLS